MTDVSFCTGKALLSTTGNALSTTEEASEPVQKTETQTSSTTSKTQTTAQKCSFKLWKSPHEKDSGVLIRHWECTTCRKKGSTFSDQERYNEIRAHREREEPK